MKKGYKYIYIPIFLSLGLVTLLMFTGYLVGIHKLPSYGFFRRVELNLFNHLFDKFEPKESSDYYDSIFLRLYKTQTDLSDQFNRRGSGGGMTSFEGTVLLLAYDGQVFVARSADNVQKSDIEVPDNGYFAYKAATHSEQFKQLNHNPSLFRYNDILYYDSNSNRGLAISYTDFDSTDNCYRNSVAIFPLSRSIHSVEELSIRPEDWDIIYQSQPCLPFKHIHYAIDGGTAGGRIVFRPPSTIYIGNGDYNWNDVFANKSIAQNPDGEYGKIISINLDSRLSRIIATGIRNPQGIVLDKNGTLWTAEHGFRGGDELNRIEEEQNYGWPLESLGTQYSKLPIPNSTAQTYGRHNNYTKPTFAWLPSVAISSLTLINGFHNSWDGGLLMGSLKSRSLFHIRIDNNRVLFSEQIEVGERVRYAHQHTDGRIILWTDSKKLIYLTGKPYTDNFVSDFLKKNISDIKMRKRIKIAVDGCRKCHSIEPEDHLSAPSLASIFNNDIASTDFKNYSKALKQKKGIWTEPKLEAFLKNPDKFAPGTQMPAPNINDDTIEEIINLLEALNAKDPD